MLPSKITQGQEPDRPTTVFFGNSGPPQRVGWGDAGDGGRRQDAHRSELGAGEEPSAVASYIRSAVGTTQWTRPLPRGSTSNKRHRGYDPRSAARFCCDFLDGYYTSDEAAYPNQARTRLRGSR